MNKTENVYYDIQVKNTESKGAHTQLMRFSESRHLPLVNKANAYELSIVRFELDTYSLPTFIADIQNDQSNPDLMIESITLQYHNTTIQKYLTWIPTNEHIPKPAPPNPIQAVSEYYYGNSFRHYCDLVNNAFDNAIVDMKIANPTLTDILAPKLIWNESSQTCSLLAQDKYFNPESTPYCAIYFNRPLHAKLSSFPASKNFNGKNGKVYKLNMNNDYSTRHITLDISSTEVLFIKTDQEYSTISNWSAVASIMFTTNSLPIVSTQLSEPRVYSDDALQSSSTGQNYQLVISDMITNELCYKPNLIYVPSAEYRFISLNSDGPIRDIDINVYWKDRKGHIIPFYLESGASASVKLYFRLKN